MVDSVAEFRKVAAQKRRQGTGARYSDGMRRFALAHAQVRLKEGAGVQTVAAELGLAGQTLAYWLRTKEGAAPSARLVPVTLTRASVEENARDATRAPIVIFSGAVRIEVPDASTAAEVVRRLR
jgi:transposase-like protein